MVTDSDYYAGLIPDDGLINDFELGLRLHDQKILDDLLNHNRNERKVLDYQWAELSLK